MDANRVQEQCKELVEKLISADPADFDDAVNQYFKPDAALFTDNVDVIGASKIKQMGKLSAWIRGKNGQVLDKPKYDAKSQTIKYSAAMVYTSPTIPSYIPLSTQLSGMQGTAHWSFVAHLEPSSGEGKKLYVAKLQATRKNPGIIDKIVPNFIIRPVFTFLSLVIVALVSFFQAHKGEGVLGMIRSAMIEVVNTMWGMIAPEIGKRQEQADKWREEKVPQIKQYIQNASSNAYDTASHIQTELETRAKSAGIPVDDYKSRATSALADLSENLEARAKSAGLPVDEYKKQAEAAIEELKKRAAEMGDYLKGKANEAKEKGVEGTLRDVKAGAEKTGRQAMDKAGEVGQAAQKKAGEAGKIAQDKAGEASQKAGEMGKMAQDKAGEVGKQAQGKAGEMKKTAEGKAGELSQKAGEAGQMAQDKAGEMGKQAQGKAQEVKKGAEGMANDAQKNAKGAKTGAKQSMQSNSTDGASNQMSQDSGTNPIALGPAVPVSTGEYAGHLSPEDQRAKEIQAEFAQVPRTPLGGHDPTAPNAPSFADAAAI